MKLLMMKNKPFSRIHSFSAQLYYWFKKHAGTHRFAYFRNTSGTGTRWLVEYLWLLTRLSNGKIPSLPQTIAGYYDLDYNDIIKHSEKIYAPLNITYGMLADRITEQCREIMTVLQGNDFTNKNFNAILTLPWITSGGDDFKNNLKIICQYICDTVYPILC